MSTPSFKKLWQNVDTDVKNIIQIVETDVKKRYKMSTPTVKIGVVDTDVKKTLVKRRHRRCESQHRR